MSDLFYDGGGSASDFNFSYPTTSSNDGGTVPSSATAYPVSVEANTYSFIKAHLDSAFTDEYFESNPNAINPYTEWYYYGYISDFSNYYDRIVDSGNTYTKKKVANHYYDFKVYNNAYIEFENVATSVQQVLMAETYNEYYTPFEDAYNSFVADSNSNYSNSSLGDITLISSLAQQIANLSTSIYDETLKDNLTQAYDRIADTDYSDLIDQQQADLLDLRTQYEQVIAEYDNNEFQRNLDQARKDQDEANKDYWNISYSWMTDNELGGLGSSSYAYVSSAEALNFIQDGSVNDWMAGGNLYDSPRAGNVFFNVTGDMNTVRFLGLQDKNFNPHLNRKLNGMAELHKMLGVTAGSKGFSVL